MTRAFTEEEVDNIVADLEGHAHRIATERLAELGIDVGNLTDAQLGLLELGILSGIVASHSTSDSYDEALALVKAAEVA
jgi:hypothetical protein